MALRPGVFLDRDGVLIAGRRCDGRPVAIRTLADLRLLPSVTEALSVLKAAGLPLAIVTNQPDVATGRVDLKTVEAIHRRLCEVLPLDAVKTCVHIDRDACDCRKPKPGMLLEAASDLGIDIARSFMVGDRWRDVAAGAAAGCATILIGDGYGEEFPVEPDRRARDMGEAARIILGELADQGDC